MYKAIKNFSGKVTGTEYKIGDAIKDEDFEDRLVRARKIEGSDETQEVLNEVVEEVEEVEETQEVLVDDTSDVELVEASDEVVTVLDVVEASEDKEELEAIGRQFGIEIDRRKGIKKIKEEVLNAINAE